MSNALDLLLDPPLYLSVSQYAALVGKSPSTIYGHLQDKRAPRIPGFEFVAGRWRIGFQHILKDLGIDAIELVKLRAEQRRGEPAEFLRRLEQ